MHNKNSAPGNQRLSAFAQDHNAALTEAATLIFTFYAEGTDALCRTDGSGKPELSEFLSDMIQTCIRYGSFVSRETTKKALVRILGDAKVIKAYPPRAKEKTSLSESEDDLRLSMAKSRVYDELAGKYNNLGKLRPYKLREIENISLVAPINKGNREINKRYYRGKRILNTLPADLKEQAFPSAVVRQHSTLGVPFCLVYFDIFVRHFHHLYNQEIEAVVTRLSPPPQSRKVKTRRK